MAYQKRKRSQRLPTAPERKRVALVNQMKRLKTSWKAKAMMIDQK